MKIKYLKKVDFSPTGATHKILNKIVSELNWSYLTSIDLTVHGDSNHELICCLNELLVIGFPVYYGRVPQTILERLTELKGDQNPAVVVAVYGNVKIDNAILEMKQFIEDRGFVTIAAASFIGEHSFSTGLKPIAQNRPDKADYKIAEEFAQKINHKISALKGLDDYDEIIVPGSTPFKDFTALELLPPEVDLNKCSQCGKCTTFCPTGAITGNIQTCTSCFACIKQCPTKARHQNSPMIISARDHLHSNFSEYKKPELFI